MDPLACARASESKTFCGACTAPSSGGDLEDKFTAWDFGPCGILVDDAEAGMSKWLAGGDGAIFWRGAVVT